MRWLRISQPVARYAVVTILLLSAPVPVGRAIGHRYGGRPAHRAVAVMAGVLAVQQALVAWVLRHRPNPRGVGLIDLMTLSRGAASALLLGLVGSGVRDRRGPAGWLGWSAAIYGAVVCDWLDGPLARRWGTSEAGAIFDLEGDSWLTLCSAIAAVAWGGLTPWAALSPVLRYPLFLSTVKRLGYGQATSGDPPWARRIGIAQMTLLLAALAPFGGRVTGRTVRLLEPVEVPVQIGASIVLYRRKMRP